MWIGVLWIFCDFVLYVTYMRVWMFGLDWVALCFCSGDLSAFGFYVLILVRVCVTCFQVVCLCLLWCVFGLTSLGFKVCLRVLWVSVRVRRWVKILLAVFSRL